MSTEIITTQNNEIEITDKKLNTYITKITKATNGMLKSQRIVARVLADIEISQCYKADGFRNCVDFATKYYGVKQDYARKLMRIGAEFINQDYSTNLTHDEDMDFSISQLAAMLSCQKPVTMREMCDSGEINPHMTFKEITEIIKRLNGKALPEPDEEESDDTQDDVDTSSDKTIEKRKLKICVSDDDVAVFKNDRMPQDKADAIWSILKYYIQANITFTIYPDNRIEAKVCDDHILTDNRAVELWEMCK